MKRMSISEENKSRLSISEVKIGSILDVVGMELMADPVYGAIFRIVYEAFMGLGPAGCLHVVRDEHSPHQERDLLSHTVLALGALVLTDRYGAGSVKERFLMVLAVMVHDAGKVVLWNTLIDQSQSSWHFRVHDTVGACWFWDLVQTHQWDQQLLRPVFLAVWFHMVKSPENIGLVYFLHQFQAATLLETVFCADSLGKLEVQSQIPRSLLTPLPVKSIPAASPLPHIPIVVYICGKSGTGKTTLARQLMEGMPEITTGYVAFDQSLLKVIGGITTPLADLDPAIRGVHIRAKSSYKKFYDIYQKDVDQRSLVQKDFTTSFKQSIATHTITFLTSTIGKPSIFGLPFLSKKFLSVVTAPVAAEREFFGSLRMAMEA